MGPDLLRSPADPVTLLGQNPFQDGMRIATGGMLGPTRFRESAPIR
jgi:hypothetical protein